MKALSLKPHTTSIALTDVPEPHIAQPDHIKMKVLQVGICGTDREQAEGGRADAPEGKSELILGHEMFGVVTEVGNKVAGVDVGDYGVFTVRRGCNKCVACLNQRSDMCFTGNYTERGIKGADGFQTEYVVDTQPYFIKVPPSARTVGVLTEPMSVAAKAIDEAVIIQNARLGSFSPGTNWLDGKKAIIAGLGPIGLLAAFALRLRGVTVFGIDVVDEDNLRCQLLREIGGIYIDGRKVKTTDIDDAYGEADFVFEATGIAQLQIELLDTLGVNGIYVATGIPAGERPLLIPASDVMRQMVLKNQLLLGSVNASIHHYKMAVSDLQASLERWPGTLEKLITKVVPVTDFDTVLHEHTPDQIKSVIQWGE